MVEEGTAIKAKVNPRDIAFLVQVMEGHGHIGVVKTTDPKAGEVELLVTPATRPEALKILENVPISLEIKYCDQ